MRNATVIALCATIALAGSITGSDRRETALSPLAIAFSPSKLTAEEKRRLFLKARERQEEEEKSAPSPQTAPAPRPWSQRSSSPTTLTREEERGESSMGWNPFSFLFRRDPDRERQIRQEKPEPPPKPGRDAPLLSVRKSGLDEEGSGYAESKPVPREAPTSYRHLTKSVRDAIDKAKVRKHRWKYIVVHHSETRNGNAKIFDYYHRRVRKMRNGLAYHFVIGNGSSSRDGQIEIGQRWTRQLNGGHVASNYLNDIAIGICLVGNFNRDKPTAAQQDALRELIHYLWQRTGKIDRTHHARVMGHKEINPRPTDCPGSRFSLRWLHHEFPY